MMLEIKVSIWNRPIVIDDETYEIISGDPHAGERKVGKRFQEQTRTLSSLRNSKEEPVRAIKDSIEETS